MPGRVGVGRLSVTVAQVPEPADPGQSGSARPMQPMTRQRSEEHTSELQSQFHLVCRLLLEKKKKNDSKRPHLAHSLVSHGMHWTYVFKHYNRAILSRSVMLQHSPEISKCAFHMSFVRRRT